MKCFFVSLVLVACAPLFIAASTSLDSLPDYPHPLPKAPLSKFMLGMGVNQVFAGTINVSPEDPGARVHTGVGFWGSLGVMSTFSDRLALRFSGTVSTQVWRVEDLYCIHSGFWQVGFSNAIEYVPIERVRRLYAVGGWTVGLNRQSGLDLAETHVSAEAGFGVKVPTRKGEHRVECVYRTPTRVSHALFRYDLQQEFIYTYRVHAVSLRYVFR